ncbi:MAG: DNA polymerase III subunit chi [Pseudomonadota bacterium]
MTRIEFHVVACGDASARLHYARDWLGALGPGARAHVCCDPDAQRELRETLAPQHPQVTVLDAGSAVPRPDTRTVLINLATDVPAFFSRYRCTLDIADKRGASVEADRSRYRFYRDRGYPITLHQIDALEVA